MGSGLHVGALETHCKVSWYGLKCCLQSQWLIKLSMIWLWIQPLHNRDLGRWYHAAFISPDVSWWEQQMPWEGSLCGIAMIWLYDFKGNLQINIFSPTSFTVFFFTVHLEFKLIYSNYYSKIPNISCESGPKTRDALTCWPCRLQSLSLEKFLSMTDEGVRVPTQIILQPAGFSKEKWGDKIFAAEEENKSTLRISALMLMVKNRLHNQVQSHPYPAHWKKFVHAYILPVRRKTFPHKA